MSVWKQIAIGIFTVAVGTLIAFAVIGAVAKKKYDEETSKNPLLKIFS